MSTEQDPASEPDVIRAYHQRTKHRFQAYARGPETLDWDAQPAPFRHFRGSPVIRLPRLSDIGPDSGLQPLLDQPVKTFSPPSPTAPTLTALGAWLQLSLGLTAWKTLGPDRWAVRANPSSGNLHPTEAYLLIHGLSASGLEDGLYHYCPEQHSLELRARHQRALTSPTLAVVLTSVMWREVWKYGERAFRYCQLDTGHAAGALRYAAGVLGWSLRERPELDTATLAALTGIDRLDEFPARRVQSTELEEAECCLQLGFAEGALSGLQAAELSRLVETAEWHGVASTIDPFPMYRWPEINAVAQASRTPQGSEPVASLPGSCPTAAPFARDARDGRIAELLLNRRSAQRFAFEHLMPRSDFRALLSRLLPSDGMPWDALAQTTRLALLLFVSRVEGLEPGLYLLPRSREQLDALTEAWADTFAVHPISGESLYYLQPLAAERQLDPKQLQRVVRSLHCHQEIAAGACFAVGMLGRLDAALEEGPDQYRALFREAGLIGQVLYLQAESLALRGTGIGCYFDDPVRELLALEHTDWQSFYHFTVGLPVLDARIESAPAYTD